jgi:hypothetical protein
MLVLFTDFDATYESFGEENLDCQVLEPEDIEDDRKRDAYLARYQGVIISTENLCVKTTIEVDRSAEWITFSCNESYF